MFGEHYPEAAEHLNAAISTHYRLAQLWEQHLASGLVEEYAVTDPDGSGRIVVSARWPEGARAELTEAFRECLNQLWATLDSLVQETVVGLSIRQRSAEPDRPRFFPLAESADGYAALLDESCLDGILVRQQRLITDCQPFREPPAAPTGQRVHAGIAQLHHWTTFLDDGALLGAWVTPVAPEIEITDLTQLLAFEIAQPGPLDEETVVATYQVVTGIQVVARTGSYLDLALPRGFRPTDGDDTFNRRVKATIDAVILFAHCFANLMSQVGPIRRVSNAEHPTPSWLAAEQAPQRWPPEVLDALAGSELGIGLIRSAQELVFLLMTPDGIFERRIQPATALNPNVVSGTAAEMATHNAAATWGLPDFVLLPKADHMGSRNREISDGLIVAGDRGIVLQVKNRAASSNDVDKETSWIDKKVAQAARQVHGTVRRLCAGAVEMTNGRDRLVQIRGSAIDWVGVVIVDHPDPPTESALQDHSRGAIPVVTLLRRDWEFLFDQLRSTRQVVDYLHRVGGPCPTLGGEPERYFELARADLEAEPDPPDPGLAGEHRSAPLLPMAPAGHDNDQAHGMIRILMEDIANSPYDGDEYERLEVLAAIDRLPVAHRTELGELLLGELLTARDPYSEEIRWRFRSYRRSLHIPQLGFGVCSTLNETTREAFRSWVLLRHHERGTTTELTNAVTVGVLLTPRSDGLRDWDTTLLAVRGDPYLDEEQLVHSRLLWDPDGPTSWPVNCSEQA